MQQYLVGQEEVKRFVWELPAANHFALRQAFRGCLKLLLLHQSICYNNDSTACTALAARFCLTSTHENGVVAPKVMASQSTRLQPGDIVQISLPSLLPFFTCCAFHSLSDERVCILAASSTPISIHSAGRFSYLINHTA